MCFRLDTVVKHTKPLQDEYVAVIESLSRRHVKLAVVGFAFGLLVVSQLLGQPAGIGFVDSNSMAPTLTAGDAFIAIPAVMTTAPEPGEVVTFRAAEINDGELTTHRIHEITDGGYITKGDANAFTDQGAGGPPVTDEQIVAKPLQVGSQVVSIPHLGAAIGTFQQAIFGAANGVFTMVGLDRMVTPRRFQAVLATAGVGLLIWSLLAERDSA
jgi:signal peptidase I, archaeal type